MAVDIKIVRKSGWILNPDDKVVNGVFRELERCDGHCPCKHPERIGHDQCPCAAYLEHDTCYCHLYVKEGEVIQKDPWGLVIVIILGAFPRLRVLFIVMVERTYLFVGFNF